jgi:hypothetical protein
MFEYQIARLERMYNFVTSDKKFKDLSAPLQVDIILSFFMHCYHLGDWLKASGVDKKLVNDFIHNTYELQVCRNLTNSTKHLELDPKTRSPPQIFDWKKARLPSPIARTYDPLAEILGEKETEHLVILVDGQEINCKDFMTKCMQKWNEFLDNNKLRKSSQL